MKEELTIASAENREALLRQKRKNKTREFLFILLVTAYPMINFIVFYLYKNMSSIALAFQEYDNINNKFIRIVHTGDYYAVFYPENLDTKDNGLL